MKIAITGKGGVGKTTSVVSLAGALARLEKRRAKAGQERERCAAKLANANFVANAPPEVVTQEQQRIAEFDRQFAQLGEQLRRLASVQSPGGTA